MMIGQNKIQNINNFDFPLIILVGNNNMGKSVVAEYIAEKTKSSFVRCGNKVEEVREVIDVSYKQIEPIIYFFRDVQLMNISALNSLLKVTEEPPFKAKFILSVDAKEHCLATLLSRAFVIELEPYSIKELKEYADLKNLEFSYNNCVYSPGTLELVNKFDYKDMYSSIKEFLDSLSYKKALELIKNIKFKEEDEGWNLLLFLNTLEQIIVEDIGHLKASGYILKFSNFRKSLFYVGVNKKIQLEKLLFELVQGGI